MSDRLPGRYEPRVEWLEGRTLLAGVLNASVGYATTGLSTTLGAYAIRNPAGGPDQIIPFGIPGAGNTIPVPGDYDGSGKPKLGVYLPSLGEFAYCRSRPTFWRL